MLGLIAAMIRFLLILLEPRQSVGGHMRNGRYVRSYYRRPPQ